MADNDNVENVADDDAPEVIREWSLTDLSAKFGPLAPLVKMLTDADRSYRLAYASKFGAETPKYAAWRDNLPTVDVEAWTATTDELSDDYEESMPLYDAVRLSNDPEYVASLISMLSELLTLAKDNLQGIYYGAKRTANVDTSDVVKLRAELDSYWTSVAAIAETPQIDMKDVSSVVPTRIKVAPKTGARRTVYDGPNIPQTRKVDILRKNARLCVVVETTNGDGVVSWRDVAGEDFGEQCKAIGLTIGELRDKFGVKLDEIHTLDNGRRFKLRRKDG